MRIFIYLYILKLIAHTESATNPKAVNVQLETVLEFNDKDKDADVKFIGNIQSILKKVKAALSPESGRRSLSNNYNSNKRIQFTDFILAAVKILLSYDDDDLVNAFAILDDEIRKYHYKGCKFYELLEDENIRKFIAIHLDDLKKNKAQTLRRKLYKLINIIGNAKLISNHKQFLDYINSLFRNESKKTFVIILQNLENYRYKSKRSNMNLIEITRNGIRSVLFDYFSKLSPSVRKNIKKNIENNWSQNKNSKSKQTNEHYENDFFNIGEETLAYNNSKEDKSEASSSISIEHDTDLKIKIFNALKKKLSTLRQPIRKNISLLTLSPGKDTIKLISQAYAKQKLKFEPLWNEKTNKQKDDFLIPSENTKLKPHSFERKKRNEKKKTNKQNKEKHREENTKNVEDNVRAEKKIKKNKHQKFKAKVEETDNVEDTVIVKEEKRNNLKSESSMKLPKTGSYENIFSDFNKLDENRHTDQELEPKVPRKHKNQIKRKQFNKPCKKNIQSHSDEGMSIENGHYRRTISSSDQDSEIEKEKENERHKISAEIIRKHFVSRINNLEKQMEEMAKKVDDTPLTNDDADEVDKKTTEMKAESSTENKVKLNTTMKAITSKGTTLNHRILIGPEYIPYKDDISTKMPSTEDNKKPNISYRQSNIASEEAKHTDFDYSEAGIMKKLNINFTLPEEKPKSNETVIEEKPKKPDGNKIEGNETGMHRIELPM